ncbi:MAG: bifunctional phosphoribosylaminoimidazolecarboxamide formyltransferase/IMP cyclohydrolase PurH, partial [Elusimicrobia bacterium]
MNEFKKTALLSVADTSGIVELAQGLREAGYRLLASGLTAKTLKESAIPVEDVTELTQYPDICGGRVRLIHPALFGGVIADRKDGDQMRSLDREKIPPIDLVAVTLYPLAQVLESGTLEEGDVVDFLDVAGAALLRAAARNYHHVITLCDPSDYAPVLDTLKRGKGLTLERSKALASKAFAYVSYYDSTVAQHLKAAVVVPEQPDEMIISLKKATELHYGENPQQSAALYSWSGARPWGLNAAELLYGKPLAFTHYLSMDHALELVAEFQNPACVMVKYGNPAGVATSDRLGEAARWAYESDPAGCTGAIAALNREVDADAANALASEYLECIVASEFSGEALTILRAKRDVRLVRLPSLLASPKEAEMKTISGGVLIQDKDLPHAITKPKTVTKRKPNDLETAAMELAWRVAKHAKTHAVVLANPLQTLGIGGGQVSRLDAMRLAIVKSEERHPVVTPNSPRVV